MGTEPISAIANAAGQLFGTVGKFADARNTKMQGRLADKTGFQDTQSRLLQLRQEREANATRQTSENARTKRTTTIVLAISGVLLIAIVFIAIIIKQKQA